MRDDDDLRVALSLAAEGRVADALALARQILRRSVGHAGALALVERIEDQAGPVVAGDDWRPGVVVEGRWEVFGSAQGGMGRVHFVRDRSWGSLALAVKSLLASTSEPEIARRLFRRETQVWLDLGAHPHIVSGFYTLTVGGALRFFMEYVEGQALSALLAKGPLAPPRILDLAIQLADGMSYVHERGVVHRDLKPANCLVMEDDTLRVTDFGLGKSSGDGDVAVRAPTTGAGELSVHGAGTPFYMAPEQWRSLAAAGPPADIYAFGILLWEIIVGRRPFEPVPACWSSYAQLPIVLDRLLSSGSPRPDLVLPLMHEHLPPLAPSQLGHAVPPSLDRLLLACMAKPPEARPTFPQAASALRQIFREAFGHDHPRKAAQGLGASPAGESNRALSYEVMGERETAIGILDQTLGERPTALYPWLNRASLALESGVEPCLVAARVRGELLPANPGAGEEDPRVAELLGRLSAWHGVSPEPLAAAVGDGVIALGGRDRLVRILDETTGRELAALGPHRDIILSLAFVGPALAVADANDVAVWQRGSPAPERLAGHRDLVSCLAVSPDGREIASGGNDRAVLVHSPRGPQRYELGALPRTLVWTDQGLHALDTDGNLHAVGRGVIARGVAAIAAADGQLLVAETSGRVGRVQSPSPVVACAGRGGWCAAAGRDGVVRVWADGAPIAETPALRGKIRALRFLERGLFVLADSGEWHVFRFRAPESWPRLLARDLSAVEKRRRQEQLDAVVTRLSAGDPRALADARELRARYPEQRRDERLTETLGHAVLELALPVGADDLTSAWTTHLDSEAWHVAPTRDGRCFGVTTPNGLTVLEAQSGRLLHHFPHRCDLGVAADELGLLLVHADGVTFVDPANGTPRWQGAWSGGEIFAADARAGLVAAAGWSRTMLRSATQAQGTIRVWFPAQRGEQTFGKIAQTITAVALSRDGRWVAGVSDDGRIHVWSIEGKVATKASAPGVGTAIAVSDDLRYLAVGQQDGLVAIWSTLDARPFLTTTAHAGAIRSLSFCARDRWLVSAGPDGAVKIWDAASLTQISSMSAHVQPARVAVSPSGTMLATAGGDHLVRLWRAAPTWLEGQAATERIRLGLTQSRAPRSDALLDAWRDASRLARHEPSAGVLANEVLAALGPLLRRETSADPGKQLAAIASRALRLDPGLARHIV